MAAASDTGGVGADAADHRRAGTGAGSALAALRGAGAAGPSDPLRYHKTTRRAHYEAAYLQAKAAGFDEVLFLNTRDEVCEGSRTNLFVQLDGRLYTPPVSCGLLPGVYRQHVLRTHPDVEERMLTLADLRRAEALYVCNAVRGWRPAVLAVPEPVLTTL